MLYICSTTYPSSWKYSWGDGLINSIEKCDDGNAISGDGWSSKWIVESNYKCVGEPSVCDISVTPNTLESIIGTGFQAAIIICKHNFITFNLGGIGQIGLSLILGTPLSGFWGFINTIQILNYASMFTLFYPRIVLSLFSFMGISDLNSDYLRDIYILQFNTSNIKKNNSWDFRFRNQHIESTNILMNCGDAFLIILFFSTIYISYFLISIALTRHPLKVVSCNWFLSIQF